MFDRRRFPAFLCALACIALAAGFVLSELGLLPLAGLFFEGWWTLLLILPSLTMFALDGYSRPALAMLASGLLLFANFQGKIPAGYLMDYAAYTTLAAVAGGAVVELTGSRLKKRAALPGKTQKKLSDKPKEQNQSPFAPEAEQEKTKRVSQVEAGPQQKYIPKEESPQPDSSQAGQSSFTRGWTPSAANAASKSRVKGWDPNKTYVEPGKAVRVQSSSRVKTQAKSGVPAVHSAGSFPQCIAIFSNSKIKSDSQTLSGALTLSLFGDARLSLRDGDYREPISVTMLSIFGSSRLEVPYVSNISVTPISLFGDCKDKRKLVNSQAMPSMQIRCISLFGDCTIL